MTPSPDKLAIPEAAVEAAARAIYEWRETAGDQIPMGALWRELPEESRQSYRDEGLAAIHGFIPHVPDRGYAEGIEAAAKSIDKRLRDYIEEHGSYDPDTGATEFPGNGDEYCAELEEIAEAIRALAPPAPADNGEVRMPHTGMTANEAARFIDSATPSPIEDVAEPSEAEVARVREHKWFSPECAESGCRSLILEHEVERLKELNDKYIWQVRDTCTRAEKAEADLAAAEADTRDERLLLAARRVRPSPVDKDARDGVLEVAGLVEALRRIMRVVSYPVDTSINPLGWAPRSIDESGSELIGEICSAALASMDGGPK